MSPQEKAVQIIEEMVNSGVEVIIKKPFFHNEGREMFAVSREWNENASKGDTLLEALEEFQKKQG